MVQPARAHGTGALKHQVATQRNDSQQHMVEHEVGEEIGVGGFLGDHGDSSGGHDHRCLPDELDDQPTVGPMIETRRLVERVRPRIGEAISRRSFHRLPRAVRNTTSAGPPPLPAPVNSGRGNSR